MAWTGAWWRRSATRLRTACGLASNTRKVEISAGRACFRIPASHCIFGLLIWTATVTRSSPASDCLETELVCIPCPIERSDGADVGPLAYRVKYHARLWRKCKAANWEEQIVEGGIASQFE